MWSTILKNNSYELLRVLIFKNILTKIKNMHEKQLYLSKEVIEQFKIKLNIVNGECEISTMELKQR